MVECCWVLCLEHIHNDSEAYGYNFVGEVLVAKQIVVMIEMMKIVFSSVEMLMMQRPKTEQVKIKSLGTLVNYGSEAIIFI